MPAHLFQTRMRLTTYVFPQQLLVMFVLLGVSWVMKLQMFLLLFLCAAVLNVIIGGFCNANLNKVRCIPHTWAAVAFKWRARVEIHS